MTRLGAALWGDDIAPKDSCLDQWPAAAEQAAQKKLHFNSLGLTVQRKLVGVVQKCGTVPYQIHLLSFTVSVLIHFGHNFKFWAIPRWKVHNFAYHVDSCWLKLLGGSVSETKQTAIRNHVSSVSAMSMCHANSSTSLVVEELSHTSPGKGVDCLGEGSWWSKCSKSFESISKISSMGNFIFKIDQVVHESLNDVLNWNSYSWCSCMIYNLNLIKLP